MDKLSKDSSLSSYFDYAPLITREREIQERRIVYQKQNKIVCQKTIDQTCYMGIEVEVEKVSPKLEWDNGWNMVPDGSLRNNGHEYVSVPVRGQNIYYLLHSLLTDLKKTGAEFTDRTSIHVHLNIRRLTVEQLATLLITYLVVENSMYRFIKAAGFNRHRNIFCVPLSEANYNLKIPYLLHQLKNNNIEVIANIGELWKKYSGLNLLPISEKGTVEFRQLGGTFDLDLIMDWINIIQCIRVFAIKTKFDDLKAQILELNTNSNYVNFLSGIFGRYTMYMMPDTSPNGYKEIEAGIINIKSAFMLRDKFGISLENYTSSSMHEYLRRSFKFIERESVEEMQKELTNKINKFNTLEARLRSTKKDGLVVTNADLEQYSDLKAEIETLKYEMTHINKPVINRKFMVEQFQDHIRMLR
jgi:hypothetical protein